MLIVQSYLPSQSIVNLRKFFHVQISIIIFLFLLLINSIEKHLMNQLINKVGSDDCHGSVGLHNREARGKKNIQRN